VGDDPQGVFDQLCAYIEKQMQQRSVPGVAIGILHGGEIYATGLGVTSVDNPLPVTDETLFQIGSISKTFTCLAVMRLVEMGKLDLHATVRTYLPDFKVADRTASAHTTIWHLLTHMSGWVGDLFEDTGAGDDAMAKYVALMADQEQLAPIGTVWSYNNAGFYLAGYLIEQVTGQRYERAMRELVFEPLDLRRCFYDPGEVITHRFAVGHRSEGTDTRVARPWPLPRAAYPAGGIACDAKELLRYARFQMGDGTFEQEDEQGHIQVVQPETMSLMHSSQASRWGDKEQIGLSWFIDDIGGTRQLTHGGGTVGQVTLLAMVPERQLAVVVLTNSEQGGAVTDGVRRWVLQHYLGLEEPEPKPIDATEEELSAYAGFYSRPFADIELGMLCGQLVGQVVYKRGFPSRDQPPPPPPPPMPLSLCEKDRLVVTGGPGKGGRAEVIRSADGTIGWLRFGRIHQRREKPPPDPS
jgi:CubicO group peptidase (beta-lactamase class C family)